MRVENFSEWRHGETKVPVTTMASLRGGLQEAEVLSSRGEKRLS
jgi:hypothetical protein